MKGTCPEPINPQGIIRSQDNPLPHGREGETWRHRHQTDQHLAAVLVPTTHEWTWVDNPHRQGAPVPLEPSRTIAVWQERNHAYHDIFNHWKPKYYMSKIHNIYIPICIFVILVCIYYVFCSFISFWFPIIEDVMVWHHCFPGTPRGDLGGRICLIMMPVGPFVAWECSFTWADSFPLVCPSLVGSTSGGFGPCAASSCARLVVH